MPIRLLVLAALLNAPLAAQDLVIENARILDPRSASVTRGTIWIAGGRIAGVAERAPADAPGPRVDAAGRWIIPGLVDAHTHSFGNAAPGRVGDGRGTAHTAQRVLRAGVVAFLDLFNMEDYVLRLRDSLRTDTAASAMIFASGPCFTAPRGHCSEYGIPTRVVSTPDDARREFLALLPKRPDVVKVVYDHADYGPTTMPTISRETLRALLAVAAEHGVRTVVHVGTWNDVRHAVLAGATAITHVPRDSIAPDDVVALLAAARTYHIPTLVVHSDLAEFYDRPALLDAPLFQALAADTIRATYRRGAASLDDRTRSWVERQRAGRAQALASVRRLHRGGVRMVVGTDGGNWGIIQGYSVHRELLRLTEAGLSPAEALAAATTTAGDFLGRRIGVRAGDEGHLVMLDASPLERIENTQRIAAVILRGRIVYQR